MALSADRRGRRPPRSSSIGDGSRILDEGLGGISITNDLARLDDPLCATVICDAPIWETAGRAAQIPPNPQLLAGGGTLHRAETIEALAEIGGAAAGRRWPRPSRL